MRQRKSIIIQQVSDGLIVQTGRVSILVDANVVDSG